MPGGFLDFDIMKRAIEYREFRIVKDSVARMYFYFHPDRGEDTPPHGHEKTIEGCIEAIDEEYDEGFKGSDHYTFNRWVRKVSEIDNNQSFLVEGLQSGEIWEWYEWYRNGLTPFEAVKKNYELYG